MSTEDYHPNQDDGWDPLGLDDQPLEPQPPEAPEPVPGEVSRDQKIMASKYFASFGAGPIQREVLEDILHHCFYYDPHAVPPGISTDDSNNLEGRRWVACRIMKMLDIHKGGRNGR